MPRRRWLWLVVAAAVAAVCVAAAVGAWAQGVRAWFLLMWAGLAGAVVFAAGLAVPAAFGRRDRRAAEVAAEQERAAWVEAELRAVMRPLASPTGPGEGLRSAEGSPAALLRAERQVVGFTGRAAELRGLGAWARGSARGVVRLITGPGGAGKTRLAVEFADRLEADGWRCGLLRAGRDGQAIAAIAAAGVPTLLVVDYAEARTDLPALLEALAAHDGEPVIRVLLLARTLGEWWQPDGPLRRHAAIRDVLAGAEALQLGPLTTIPLRQQETFYAAMEAFAGHYGIPAPATTLRPVAKDTPVLLLHAAALTAVLDARQGSGAASVSATEDVVAELLGHEDNYWSSSATVHGLDQLGVGAGARRQVVAIAGLLGADSEQEARDVLRRLPVLADATALTVEQVLGWLRELYPATGSSWLGSIQPDLLLEYLVTSVFSGSSELADAALTGLPEHRALHALTVLARALDHYPASAGPLLRRLILGHANVLAMPAVQLARNLDNATLGQLLADVLTNAPVTDEVLAALAADLRQAWVSLVAVTVTVYLRVGVGGIAAGQLSTAIETAQILTSIAFQLTQDGFQGAAVDAQRAAVTLYRAVEQAEPGRHRADLARALANLGFTLQRLGRDRDAHQVQVEAVELYRAMEQAEPGRYRANLALALVNLNVTLNGLGQHRDAQPVGVEAVELWRAAEEAKPGRQPAELALALGNLGATLSRLGHYQDAHNVEVEAVELYRAAEETEPGRHRAELATALANLGVTLQRLGQEQDAHPVKMEAVELYRAMNEAEPGRHRAELATALANLGLTLSLLGHYQDAHNVEVEAVELYRAMEMTEPGRYQARLADALVTLGVTLTALGQHRDAHPVKMEAVDLYRAAEPGDHRADLARALGTLAATLSRLGQDQDAVTVEVEAVDLYRAVEEAEPGRYRTALALALASLGTTLSALDQHRDAHPVQVEAADLYRAVEQAEPGRHRADLADALASLGLTLSHLGRAEEALAITGEAVSLYRGLTDTNPAAYRSLLAKTLATYSGILLDLGRLDDAQNARHEADLHGAGN